MFPTIPFVLLFQLLVVIAAVTGIPPEAGQVIWMLVMLLVGVSIAAVVAYARAAAKAERDRVHRTPDPSDDAAGEARAAALDAIADALEKLKAGDVLGAMGVLQGALRSRR